jgi:hypothetical protein
MQEPAAKARPTKKRKAGEATRDEPEVIIPKYVVTLTLSILAYGLWYYDDRSRF